MFTIKILYFSENRAVSGKPLHFFSCTENTSVTSSHVEQSGTNFLNTRKNKVTFQNNAFYLYLCQKKKHEGL